jgi:hypothetical protein
MLFAAVHESAFGTKRTIELRPPLSAFEPKRTLAGTGVKNVGSD